MISAYEHHPDWTNSWLSDNQNKLEPANAYYLNGQPSIILFKIKY
jgi:hypothetical protein